MNATKRTTEDKLAIKSAKAHHKQFKAKHPARANTEELYAKMDILRGYLKAKANFVLDKGITALQKDY